MILILADYIIGVFQFFLVVQFSQIIFPYRQDKRFLRFISLLVAAFLLVVINMLEIPAINLAMALLLNCAVIVIILEGRILYKIAVALLGVLCLAVCEAMMGAAVQKMIIFAEMSINTPGIQSLISTIGMFSFLLIVLIIRVFVLRRKQKMNGYVPSVNYSTIGLLIVSILVLIYITSREWISTGEDVSVLPMLCAISLVIINAIIIINNENDYKQIQLQNELASMTLQEEQLAELTEEQAIYLKRQADFAHDFKRYLTVLLDMVISNSVGEDALEKVKYYVNDLLGSLELTPHYQDIENNALRVILERMRANCEAANISFSTLISYSSFAFMSYKDICALFMNALDNAYEACIRITNSESRRSVELSINKQGAMVFISVKNSSDNSVLLINGEIQSVKAPNGHHGIGVKNMQRIATQYGGQLHFQSNQNEFSLLLIVNDSA